MVDTLLFVEDNPMVLLAAKESLEEAGFDVVAAEDGPAAIRLMTDQAVLLSALVTDYLLPNMNGAEIVEEFRRNYPNNPAIIASAFPDAVTDEWLRRYRTEFLMKPYTSARLIELVKVICAKS